MKDKVIAIMLLTTWTCVFSAIAFCVGLSLSKQEPAVADRPVVQVEVKEMTPPLKTVLLAPNEQWLEKYGDSDLTTLGFNVAVLLEKVRVQENKLNNLLEEKEKKGWFR